MGETSTLILTPETITAHAARLSELGRGAAAAGRRFVLGIAGVPASGKSTLAERLTALINAEVGYDAAVFIPMDGFHLPNAVLEARATRSRKGAWFTYDAEAYLALLRRYRDAKNVGKFPVYCRAAHEPVPSAQRVGEQTRIIVTEGQYLLVNETPWLELEAVLDETWWLDVTPEHARTWLRKRDLAVGRDVEEAEAKYERNDRLNADWMLARRRPANVDARWPQSPDHPTPP